MTQRGHTVERGEGRGAEAQGGFGMESFEMVRKAKRYREKENK